MVLLAQPRNRQYSIAPARTGHKATRSAGEYVSFDEIIASGYGRPHRARDNRKVELRGKLSGGLPLLQQIKLPIMAEEHATVTLITGAAAGIGRALAAAYAQANHRLVLLDKAAEDLTAYAESLAGEVLAIPTDVSEPEAIERAFAQATDRFGGIDILINNAGLSRFQPMEELAVAEWDYILNSNLRAVFLCSRAAARTMRERGGGSIVNIASTRALMSEPDSEAYAASKGGILALTHALAASLGPDGIRVNAISPGWIETGDYAALEEKDHAQHLAGRVGKPADIAKACFYLTDPENDFVTGTNLVVDGGMTRKMIYQS